MRILFVAMSESIHTARWISQISDQGWEIHLYPSLGKGHTHPLLKNTTVHHTFFGHFMDQPPGVKTYGLPTFSNTLAVGGRYLLESIWPEFHRLRLNYLIKSLKPDIIHSLEIQAAGYLTLAAKNNHPGKFPTWIVTNWGSDIYLFSRLSAHTAKIRAVLQACDYYSCECNRDIGLARELGFQGGLLPVIPNSGGFHLSRSESLRQPGNTSERKLILLKGYQSFAGRALVGLRAIALCAKELQGYKVAIFVANSDVAIAAELVSKSTGIPIEIIPTCSHEEMLSYYGQSRVYIGLSISDAISTSLLEAMVMGAFPIQSCTACAEEWIEDGRSGFIVPPEDPEIIAEYLKIALHDDRLVDHAAVINFDTAKDRLDQTKIKPIVVDTYNKIFAMNARS